MSRHDIPLTPATREAGQLTARGVQVIRRGREVLWDNVKARRFGQFVRDLPERKEFAAWAKLRRAGRAPANQIYENLWQKFLSQ